MDDVTAAQLSVMAARLCAVVQTVAEFPDGAPESYVMQGAMASHTVWQHLRGFLIDRGLIRVEHYRIFPTAKTGPVSTELDDVVRRAHAGELAGPQATASMMRILAGDPAQVEGASHA